MKIIFAGTPEFSASHLEFLLKQNEHSIVGVFTQPDRPSGRGRKLKPSPVKKVAERNQIPIFHPISFRDIASVKMVQKLQADLIIVVAYGLILTEAVLKLPRFGCINVHASLLPRWRGAAPIQRSIEAGDSETGISIMQMDTGLDTGDVLATSRCTIGPADNAESISRKLCDLGGPALLNTIQLIAQGRSIPIPQNDSLSCYAEKIKKNEALINWHSDSVVIERKIRAFNPSPGAYSIIDSKRIKVFSAINLQKRSTESPGTILTIDKMGLEISCGKGNLLLEEIQLEGKSRIHVREMLKSRMRFFRVGQRFE